ncbi:hypothetical protein STEG23_028881 [Scotinomys teguina]
MLEIEKLSKRSGNTDASITNRIEEMEDRISNVEDTIEKIDSTVKENTKTKKAIKQNVQEIWDTMKRPNIRIIRIEEGEEYQLKGTENIFNKIIEENFPNLKKEPPIRIQEAYRAPNRLDPQKKSSRHIIIKTLNIQNKERILRAAKEKGQLTYKGRPIRITPDFTVETLQARRDGTFLVPEMFHKQNNNSQENSTSSPPPMIQALKEVLSNSKQLQRSLGESMYDLEQKELMIQILIDPNEEKMKVKVQGLIANAQSERSEARKAEVQQLAIPTRIVQGLIECSEWKRFND